MDLRTNNNKTQITNFDLTEKAQSVQYNKWKRTARSENSYGGYGYQGKEHRRVCRFALAQVTRQAGVMTLLY